MTDISELPAHSGAGATNDLLVIWDESDPSDKTKKAELAAFLGDYVKDGDDAAFGDTTHDLMTATAAVATTLTLGSKVVFPSTKEIQNVYLDDLDFTPSDITAGNAETVTATLTGILTGDTLIAVPTAAISDGLMWQAWISAGNTISVRFYNPTASTITGATHNFRCLVLRAA